MSPKDVAIAASSKRWPADALEQLRSRRHRRNGLLPVDGRLQPTLVVAIRTRTERCERIVRHDSCRQCHSVANSTAGRLNGLRQSYHLQHELRARRLSKIHSTVDLYSITSDLKSVEKSHAQFEHSGGHVTSRHTVANRWTGQENWFGGGAAGDINAAAARSLCIYKYKLTGTNIYATVGDRAFSVAEPRVWNTLPEEITTSQSLLTVHQQLKTWLFRK